jgi:hypothetical protein
MGRCTERATRSTWSLARGRLTTSYHITWKELKALRQAFLSFMPLLRGRKLLMHEDNQAVVVALSHLTSRSQAMMGELRKL